MTKKFFLDTNILIYTFDHSSPDKQKAALALVGEALEDRAGVISYQVIQEFINVATRKFTSPMTANDLAFYFRSILLPLCEIHSSAGLYTSAMRSRIKRNSHSMTH